MIEDHLPRLPIESPHKLVAIVDDFPNFPRPESGAMPTSNTTPFLSSKFPLVDSIKSRCMIRR